MATDGPTLKSSVLAVRAGLVALSQTTDGSQRRYLAELLAGDAATLAERCLNRCMWLETAYEWLETHRDELGDDELRKRDEQWIQKLRQYETAMDLLGQALEALPVMDAVSSDTAPLTQEAFL